jgi:hypothetical protein
VVLVEVVAAEARAEGEKEAMPTLPPRRLRRERVTGAVASRRRRSKGETEYGKVV